MSDLISWILIIIIFIAFVSSCCGTDNNSSGSSKTRNKTTTSKGSSKTYYENGNRECPACGAPNYSGYCDECGYPDINQGWLGENF